MSYRKLIVGTDGSETAAVAERTALRLANACDAELRIVSAYRAAGAPGGSSSKAAADEILGRAEEVARAEGIRASTEALEGEPADVIVDMADRWPADLIVVGNKGMGRATRFRLGSVADRVAYFAPSDVLIVNTTRAVAAGSTRPVGAGELYRRILIGTDGSPTASEAAYRGFELAEILGGEVALVHVGDPVVGAIVLEQTAEGRPGRAKVGSRTLEGDPAEKICELAEMEGLDLIVVGNKGMSGARRFLLGSIPNKVAHYSPTDVLIVKTVGRSIEELEPGRAGIVLVGSDRVAAYKDESGQIHAFSPRCTHMGCTVGWNEADRTWDCPCHGSRYTYEGDVIRGPAKRGLSKIDLTGA
jgi:nucleotide-binding universal stress UspA family protein/nitrite reductase/ring-hydroxylating ferredoxin subunit